MTILFFYTYHVIFYLRDITTHANIMHSWRVSGICIQLYYVSCTYAFETSAATCWGFGVIFQKYNIII